MSISHFVHKINIESIKFQAFYVNSFYSKVNSKRTQVLKINIKDSWLYVRHTTHNTRCIYMTCKLKTIVIHFVTLQAGVKT